MTKTPSYALVIIDTTKGFCQPGYPLCVPGAGEVGPAIDRFIRKLRNTTSIYLKMAGALVTNDTHFEGEYKFSPEAAVFDFHQGWGTEERDYTFDISLLAHAMPTAELFKNKFDMWAVDASVGVPVARLRFGSQEEAEAYDNLFKVKLPTANGGRYQSRESFFEDLKKKGVDTLVICGVATDYCVYCAMVGALENSFKVIFLQDLAAGIFVPSISGGTGRYDGDASYTGVKTLEELVASRPILEKANREGRFTSMTSEAFLQLN